MWYKYFKWVVIHKLFERRGWKVLDARKVREEILALRKEDGKVRQERELAYITARLEEEVEKAKKEPWRTQISIKIYMPSKESIAALKEAGWTVLPDSEEHNPEKVIKLSLM